MSKRPRIPPKALRDIWDQVPKMLDCKGLCSDSCGPIPVSRLERSLIEERAGKKLETVPNIAAEHIDGMFACSMLTKDGLCSVYAIRPLICRIWGAAQGIPCTHGCTAERLLTPLEALQLFEEIEAISGDSHDDSIQDMLALMTDFERQEWKRGLKGQVTRRAAMMRQAMDE